MACENKWNNSQESRYGFDSEAFDKTGQLTELPLESRKMSTIQSEIHYRKSYGNQIEVLSRIIPADEKLHYLCRRKKGVWARYSVVIFYCSVSCSKKKHRVV
jgi:hypothetical protein